MNRKIRILALAEEARPALQAGHHSGKSSAYRNRCHIILLKSEGCSSKDVAAITRVVAPAVNNWGSTAMGQPASVDCKKSGPWAQAYPG